MNKSKDMQMYLQMFSPYKKGDVVKRQFSESDYALCFTGSTTPRKWIRVCELEDATDVVAVEVVVKS